MNKMQIYENTKTDFPKDTENWPFQMNILQLKLWYWLWIKSLVEKFIQDTHYTYKKYVKVQSKTG